jgi:hypothetical protein
MTNEIKKKKVARVTVNRIVKAVKAETGLSVEMDKFEGVYYWCGEVATVLAMESENCTHMVRLNDWTLARWIESFVEMVLVFERANNITVQQQVDEINWQKL